MSKKISEEKLKAFSVGRVAVKKSPFELEKERREQKKREEELAAAKVFEEFVGEFDDDVASKGKTFVRGDVIVPQALYRAQEGGKPSAQAGQQYVLDLAARRGDTAKYSNVNAPANETGPEKETKPIKGKKVPKMSNLEAMKEKLKREQEEREMRQALRQMNSLAGSIEASQSQATPSIVTLLAAPTALAETPTAPLDDSGSHYTGDNTATNIYVGNLHPKVTEEMLCQTFGQYGPLASVKVMWPRTPEEHARGHNCGFVAFMTRPDAEKAYDNLNGKELMEFEMRLGWGKGIALPPQPFYVHPSMESVAPAQVSDLPFGALRPKKADSAKSTNRDYMRVAPPGTLVHNSRPDSKEADIDLSDAEVHVIMPRDLSVRRLIHKTIEYVITHGPMFEAQIMHREMGNPHFRFLCDNTSPQHIYYRWKLYSILQGDHPHEWSRSKFRMFSGGSWWVPPSKLEDVKKGQLSVKDRDELESILRTVQMDRNSIRRAMGFSIDHSDAAEEIVECVSESLCILETPIPTKIARLFVVSDLLHNTAVTGASYFRTGFEQSLPEIMRQLNAAFHAISGRMRAEYFKKHVLTVLSAWDQWFLYPKPFLEQLRQTYLAPAKFDHPAEILAAPSKAPVATTTSTWASVPATQDTDMAVKDEEIDGEAIDGDDIDGDPITTAPQSKDEVKLRWAPVAKAKIDSKWDDVSDEEEDSKGRQAIGGSYQDR